MIKVAATGNNMDAAIYNMVNLKECVEEELKKKFTRCDVEIFKEKLASARIILILGDNVGKTVFDRVLC